MKGNVMNVFVSVYVVFVMAGWITMQFAEAATVSHKGMATVKAIDWNKNIVKLAHGPIASFKWPAMTMNFQIKEHTLMQGIKVGDSVAFTFI
jgi:Cu/Ag efflux protein CusF